MLCYVVSNCKILSSELVIRFVMGTIHLFAICTAKDSIVGKMCKGRFSQYFDFTYLSMIETKHSYIEDTQDSGRGWSCGHLQPWQDALITRCCGCGGAFITLVFIHTACLSRITCKMLSNMVRAMHSLTIVSFSC